MASSQLEPWYSSDAGHLDVWSPSWCWYLGPVLVATWPDSPRNAPPWPHSLFCSSHQYPDWPAKCPPPAPHHAAEEAVFLPLQAVNDLLLEDSPDERKPVPTALWSFKHHAGLSTCSTNHLLSFQTHCKLSHPCPFPSSHTELSATTCSPIHQALSHQALSYLGCLHRPFV